MENENSCKDMSQNYEMLENIHIRYLDEIKQLNCNLQSFKIEKENEIKQLNEKLKLSEDKLKISTMENETLREQLDLKKQE